MKMVRSGVFLKFLVMILSASLFTSLVPMWGASYVVGAVDQTGVPKNAVHIQTADQLAGIGGAQSVGRYFVLDNDIDLADEWVPINDFRGKFDGQGYSISGLYVLESSSRLSAGLFGKITVNGTTIKNVGVHLSSKGLTASASRTAAPASACAGGLVGYVVGSVFVENCYVVGDVIAVADNFYSSGAYAGGLIGSGGGTVVNSYTSGDITATSSISSAYAGGLIGSGGSVVVENSYTAGDVTASGSGWGLYPACAGGLVGYSGSGATVTNSYALGNIAATTTTYYSATASKAGAGGLVGYSGYGDVIVTNSYTTGDITATAPASAYAGGLIGYTWIGYVIMENSYVVGDITSSGSPAYVGGLASYSDGGIVTTNCFRISSQKLIGDTINDAGKPLSPKEMKLQQSFIDWDFETIWAIDPHINKGYPHLIPITPTVNDANNLFGSFWFATLSVMIAVLVVVGIVYMLLHKRRSKSANLKNTNVLNGLEV